MIPCISNWHAGPANSAARSQRHEAGSIHLARTLALDNPSRRLIHNPGRHLSHHLWSLTVHGMPHGIPVESLADDWAPATSDECCACCIMRSRRMSGQCSRMPSELHHVLCSTFLCSERFEKPNFKPVYNLQPTRKKGMSSHTQAGEIHGWLVPGRCRTSFCRSGVTPGGRSYVSVVSTSLGRDDFQWFVAWPRALTYMSLTKESCLNSGFA